MQKSWVYFIGHFEVPSASLSLPEIAIRTDYAGIISIKMKLKFNRRMLFTSRLHHNLGTRFTFRRGQYNVNSGFNNCNRAIFKSKSLVFGD